MIASSEPLERRSGCSLAPYGHALHLLVSFHSMMQHEARSWFRIAQMIHAMAMHFGEYTENDKTDLQQSLSMLYPECEQLQLRLTCLSIRRFQSYIENSDKLRLEQCKNHWDDIEHRLLDEMEAMLFLYVPPDRSSYFCDTCLFGSQVDTIFRESSFDIEEAGKCLALGRGTGCVFHLMRVMEVLLRHVGKLLAVKHAPSWESYIHHIASRISAKHRTKGIRWKRDEPFFKDVLGDLQSVKIAWRNPTMHVERKYTIEEAEAIFRAVRKFSQHLAEHETIRRRRGA